MHAQIHTHTHMGTHARAHIHTQIHTHTHAHRHACARTRTHTLEYYLAIKKEIGTHATTWMKPEGIMLSASHKKTGTHDSTYNSDSNAVDLKETQAAWWLSGTGQRAKGDGYVSACGTSAMQRVFIVNNTVLDA